jgi:hypothetical protein
LRGVSDTRRLLEEQKAYYRARAPEYDDWFLRRGPYDGGPDENRRWFAEVRRVRDVSITAVDASPEVLELNHRASGAAGGLEYVLADVFEWKPRKLYDAVFFSFWLSHVPPGRFGEFWERVAAALKADGRVFFVDSLQRSTAVRMSRPAGEDGVEIRALRDGREFRVVKLRYDPDRLQADLEKLGWRGGIRQTDRFFIYGELAKDQSR